MSITSGSAGFDCGNTEDTRNNLRNLRNAQGLEPGCLYTATDVSWVIAGGNAARFTAAATDEGSLSTVGYYESDLLNPGEPWEAKMDWDTGQIFYMHDSHIRENEVYGNNEVRSFPWGTTSVRRMTVKHATFSYTAGTVDNVTVQTGGEIQITGGSILETDVVASGRLRVLGNSAVRDVLIETEGRLYINADGAVVNQVTVSNETTVTASGAVRLEESAYNNRSTVLVDGGSHYRFNVDNTSYVDARGWVGNFRQLDLTRMDFRISGTGIVQNSVMNGLGYARLRNVVDLNLTHVSYNGYGYLSADRAENFRMSYESFNGMGYIYANDSVNVNIQRGTHEANGTLNLTSAKNVTITRGTFSENGQFYAPRSSGRIDYLKIELAAYVRADDATGYDFDQSEVGSGSYMDLRTSVNFIMREHVLGSNALIYASGSENARIRYGEISRSNVYIRNTVNAFLDNLQLRGGYYNIDGSTDQTYNALSSTTYGYLRGVNAPAGRITRVTLTGYGLIRLQGNIAAGWSISDMLISSQSDLRMESGGTVSRSTLVSRGILTARHTGTIDRAHIMQVSTIQTTASTNLILP